MPGEQLAAGLGQARIEGDALRCQGIGDHLVVIDGLRLGDRRDLLLAAIVRLLLQPASVGAAVGISVRRVLLPPVVLVLHAIVFSHRLAP